MRLSVVTTIYRTAHCVEEFHRRATKAAAVMGLELELVLVNDGSPDNGREVAEALTRRDPRVVAVDLARNFGQHQALLTGMRIATGDLVAILDGDLDEDPLWLVDFFRIMNEQGSDSAFGISEDSARSVFYRWGQTVFYRGLSLMSGVSFPRNVTTARLMTRRFVDAVLEFDEREIYLGGLLHMVGFDQSPLLVKKSSSSATSYDLYRLAYLFASNIISFSVRPLMVISLVGVVISAVASVYLAYLLVHVLVHGTSVPGWASVIGAVVFLSGVGLFVNGIIAIYVAMIFLEVKKRPRVVIRSTTRRPAKAD